MYDRRESDRKYRQEHKKEAKEYMKQYYINNKEKLLEYRQEHKEHLSECHKKWLEDNKEHCKIYGKQYRKTNSEYVKEIMEKWRENNREYCIEYTKKWNKNHPEEKKEIEARHYNKRKRNLGFNPLNKPFENSEAHHINSTDIIYIPKEIHRSIWHCLEINKNMKEINKIAMNYLEKKEMAIC